MNNKLIRIVEQFKNKKILVIGDLMLDKYVWGSVSRISPEAPVQIVNVKNEDYVPGGTANVANNIAALNGVVFLVGLVGDDDAKKILMNEIKKRNILTDGLITHKEKPTIQKVRIIAHNQQLLRIDYEKDDYVECEYENKIINYIKSVINKINAVVVSDYAKGVITKQVMVEISKLAERNNKPLIIDPKPVHKNLYSSFTLISPNYKEACEMIGIKEHNGKDINEIGKTLMKDFNSNILITHGEHGMTLFEKGERITNIPTKAKEVYDVSGAGDTVVSALTLSLVSGASFKEAAEIANHAAGVVVGKVGTATIKLEELKKVIGE
jgi:D-beta-D-heptose 7-phosphate kinase/D-beta-D-heptose 1-phosphate adenosyltransferase